MGSPRGLGALVFVGAIGWFAACEPTWSPTAPAYRRTIAGTVREAGGGGPLADVEIVGPSDQDRERPKAVTAKDGSFRFEQTLYETLWFEKQGYQPAQWWLPREANLQELQTLDVKMQSRIFLPSSSSFSSGIGPDDASFEGSYPFGDEGEGYECRPCKLIEISAAEQGANLRLSWSGSIPLSLWAGNTLSWDGPYVRAIGRPGASETAGSTRSRIDAVLVGIDWRTRVTLSGAVAFTLTIERF